MLVIKFYAGIVTKIVLSMEGFQANSDIDVAVAKELSLKVILTMPVKITSTIG